MELKTYKIDSLKEEEKIDIKNKLVLAIIKHLDSLNIKFKMYKQNKPFLKVSLLIDKDRCPKKMNLPENIFYTKIGEQYRIGDTGTNDTDSLINLANLYIWCLSLEENIED